jgi:hypothetical protein
MPEVIYPPEQMGPAGLFSKKTIAKEADSCILQISSGSFEFQVK